MPPPDNGAIQSAPPLTGKDIAPETEQVQDTKQDVVQETPPEGSIGALFKETIEPQPKPLADLPAKFQGKSLQEIAKSASEAEKSMHAKAQEAADLKKQLAQKEIDTQRLIQQQQQEQQARYAAQQTQSPLQPNQYLKQLADLQFSDAERYQAEMLRFQSDLAEAKARAVVEPLQQFVMQSQALQAGQSVLQNVTAHPQYQAFKDVLTQEAIFNDPMVQRELKDVLNGTKSLNQIDYKYLTNVLLGNAMMQNPQVIEGQFERLAASQAQTNAQARSLAATGGVSRTGSSPTAALSSAQLDACKAMGISPGEFAKYLGQV